MAIVVLTLAVRLAVLPLSWRAALAGRRKRQAAAALEPELARLKALYQSDQAALAHATMALYRAHGVTMLDRYALLNMGWQWLSGAGLFQVLRSGCQGRFLWLASIAPDIALTVLVGVLTALGMALAPGAGATVRGAGR